MQIHFSPKGISPRWAWTQGLSTLGQQEVTVPLPWPSDDPRDQQIIRLLTVW